MLPFARVAIPIVGSMVGGESWEGWDDGVAVEGASVGSLLGAAVGLELDGAVVGLDGIAVGCPLGWPVGCMTGCCVG